MSRETDVIIIGAGASGLSAARELGRLGVGFTLIEGAHRIGGRAYSEEIAPGVWFDLGCSYLHQAHLNPFVTIADELGIALAKDQADLFDDANITQYRNGRPLSPDARRDCDRYRADCSTTIRASVERGEDVAVADLVDLNSPWCIPYMAGMASLNTLDIDETSAADYYDFGGGQDIPVPGGYGNLVAAWGSDIPVSLNTRVEKTDWSGPGVSVETTRGTLRGKAVLTTVSNGVLNAGDILFNPALPDWKQDAIRGLPTGTLNKVCVHFERDVFGPDGPGWYSTWHDSDDTDDHAAGFEASVMGLNTGIVFTGGRHAIWLEKQGQTACHDFAVNRIADVFGNRIRKRVTRSIATAWTTEPWTRGSYSMATPGNAHRRRELARPLENRLFFAGEATVNGAQATCHGAYLSGIRAANEIAAVLATGTGGTKAPAAASQTRTDPC